MPNGLEDIIYRLVGRASGASDLVKQANAEIQSDFYKSVASSCGSEHYNKEKCAEQQKLNDKAFQISWTATLKLEEFLEKLDKSIKADGKITVAELCGYLTSLVGGDSDFLTSEEYSSLFKKCDDLTKQGKAEKAVIDYTKSKYYRKNDSYHYARYEVHNLDSL